jgi:murein DD-endopeptidase / murein LD-carboxypeptidase
MECLFFVSVAVGILSGTVNSAQAQTSVNLQKLGNESQPRFIEGIEIKRAPLTASVAMPAVQKTTVPVSKPVQAITTVKEDASSTIENCTSLQFKYAMLMDVEVETVKSIELFGFIEDWWATRYRYGGTTKRGVDCSAYTGHLVSTVYGFALPRTAREQYRTTRRVSREDLLEGDLVFFNTRGGVSHVGVYVGNGHFTHSSCHSGVTISSLNDPYYAKRYIGGGRIEISEATPETNVSE